MLRDMKWDRCFLIFRDELGRIIYVGDGGNY